MLSATGRVMVACTLICQLGCSGDGSEGAEAQETGDSTAANTASEPQAEPAPSGDSAEQSYEEALRIMCDAPAVAADISDPAQRAHAMAQHVQMRLKNPEAIQMFTAMAQASAEQRRDHLREEAERAGFEDCPLVDEL